ncbi:MAG: NRDE family protein [Acidobacteriota bacterium]|nr:NRDE family protein [Acidobacteriota bacterium]
MCIAFLAYQKVPGRPLILAANRDEYFARPTQPMHFWEDAPYILAGRDLRAGGTWLGISRKGRLALVTNYREFQRDHEAPSRGGLVRDVLEGMDLDAFNAKLKIDGHFYHGFNLIYGTVDRLFYFSNRAVGGPIQLKPGIHGLSNALLDTPWPKIRLGKELMGYLPLEAGAWRKEVLFGIMTDRDRPKDQDLPDTGVGIDVERLLSPVFITSEKYGTRCSTVIILDDQDGVFAEERNYKKIPEIYTSETFQFKIGS